MQLAIVIDCADPERLCAFWEPALGYTRFANQDPQYVVLLPTEGDKAPWVLLQRVAEPKTGKNRVHIDLHGGEPEDEARRLEALGARRLSEEMGSGPSRWIVMADPEDNEFCVCKVG